MLVELNQENFEEEVVRADKKVLVDFTASWWPHCQVLSPVLEEIAKENKNFKVTKLDVDGQKKFARKFKVMSIPTLIVFENGVETNRVVGGVSKEDILAIMK